MFNLPDFSELPTLVALAVVGIIAIAGAVLWLAYVIACHVQIVW